MSLTQTLISRMTMTDRGPGGTPAGDNVNRAFMYAAVYDKVDALLGADMITGADFGTAGSLMQLTGTLVNDASTGTVNNLTLPDKCVTLQLTAASALTLNGMTNGRTGRVIVLKNNSTSSVFIAHASGSATAGNRFACQTSQGQWLGTLGSAIFFYDGTFWRLHTVEPGGPVPFTPSLTSTGGGTPLYSIQTAAFMQEGLKCYYAGRITLNGAGFGTLAAGNLQITLPLSVNPTWYGALYSPFFQGMLANWSWLGGYDIVGGSGANLTGSLAAGGTATTSVVTKADITVNFDIIFNTTYMIAI